MTALPEGTRCGYHGTDTSSGRCTVCDTRPEYPRTLVRSHPDAMMVPVEELYRLHREGVSMDVLMAGGAQRNPAGVRAGTWTPARTFIETVMGGAASLRLTPSGMVVLARYTPPALCDEEQR